MPTFRGRNLRSGDLTESVGLLLLQSVAFVAPVPRTEDVGIDAVVTLHRRFDAQRLIAEESFCVQIKSSSVDSIEYTGDEVKWLYELDSPLFFASVDRAVGRINLFSSQQLAEAFVTNHDRKRIEVYFDGTPNIQDVVDSDQVRLGPPVAAWDLESCGKDLEAVRALFYRVVKPHVQIQRTNLQRRSIGWVANVQWRTNEEPPAPTFKTVGAKPPQEMLAIAFDEMMPAFAVWHGELIRTGDWKNAAEVLSLLDAAKKAIKAFKARGLYK